MSTRPDDDLVGARTAHVRMTAVVTALDDAAARRPSRLPGWSVAHVVTHLARNADGLRNIVEGAMAGEVAAMYPGGPEQRTADIEAGATRPATALVSDLATASRALETAWDAAGEHVWAQGKGTAFGNERAVRDLPFIRWREVEVHLVDMGLDAFGVDDWSDAYVEAELRRQLAAWRHRQPEGRTELPAAAEALPPAHRLAWLIGRLQVPELGDPGPWS